MRNKAYNSFRVCLMLRLVVTRTLSRRVAVFVGVGVVRIHLVLRLVGYVV